MRIAMFDDQSAEVIAPIRELIEKALKPSHLELIHDIPTTKRKNAAGLLSTYDAFFVDLYFDSVATGLELIEMLGKSHPFTPIIALSDTRDPNDVVSATSRGAAAFEFKHALLDASYDPENLIKLVEAAERSVNRLTLIHISDLHAHANIDHQTISNLFIADAARLLASRGIAKPDMLICTGDIANTGSKEDYAIAQLLLENIITGLHIGRNDVLLVPGNHDVDWQIVWYQWYSTATVPNKYKAKCEQLFGGLIYTRDGQYQRRMDNYTAFSRYFGAPVFLSDEQDHGWCVTIPKLFLQFYCFNTACQIDEFHPKRIRIPSKAATSCLTAAETGASIWDAAQVQKHLLRIAVMHHPPHGPEGLDPKDQTLLGRLSDQNVAFLMHGHVHDLERETIFKQTGGRKLNVLGAGSLGAASEHRPDQTPAMYHIIEIDRRNRNALIHTRAQWRDNGRFEPYSIWVTDDPLSNAAYYECKF